MEKHETHSMQELVRTRHVGLYGRPLPKIQACFRDTIACEQ